MKTILTLVMLSCGLVACGGQNPATLSLPPMSNLDSESMEHVNAMWPVLLEKCQGLNKYAADLSVSSASMIEYDGRKWVNLDISVNDSLRQIPPAYFASGEHCHFALYQDGQIVVAKKACMAVCKDRTPSAFEGQYELMI